MRALWGMGEQIAVLVDRAVLKSNSGSVRRERLLQFRGAIDDEQFRGLQAACNQVVEQRPPGRLAFAAHAADRKQHFLSVRADAERDQHRDRVRRDLGGDVALFAHGQLGGLFAARWIGLPPAQGQHFSVGPASIGMLSWDRDRLEVPVVALWNAAPGVPT